MNRRRISQHLREEQICEWVAGGRNPDVQEHLETCGHCRADVAGMRGVFGGLQKLVREESEQHIAGWPNVVPERPAPGRFGFGWPKLPVAALLTLFIAVAAWLPWRASRAVPLQEVSSAADDAALLQRIDADVSRTVPGPMEPLSSLMQWQPEATPAGKTP
jgi:hypothetical protein